MAAAPLALVTGAARGLGRALAQELAARGYALLLADREQDALNRVADEINTAGGEALAVRCDVTKTEDLEALAEAVRSDGRPLALLVNNAGTLISGNAWELPAADWQRVLDVNLLSVIHNCRTFIPAMLSAGGGHIVNVASMAGLAVGPWLAPYTVSKFGVVALSESLSLEMRACNLPIDISVVCPGPVNTGIAGGLDTHAGSAAGQMSQGLKQHIEAGLDPADAARMIADGIAAKQFWIFTHEEARHAAQARLNSILSGQAPALPF